MYKKKVEKYEDKLTKQIEKSRYYKETSKSLTKIIKKWEHEIENLASTNKKLHDLVIGLESELDSVKTQEAKLQTQVKDQKNKIVILNLQN